MEVESFAAAKRTRRTVTLTDFGRGGVCLLANGPWGAGERLTLFLPAGEGRVIPVVCTVRNSTVMGERFRVGAEFTAWCEVPFGGLVHSVDGLHAITPVNMPGGGGSAADRRAPRRILSAEARIYPMQGSGPTIEARVVDASPGGLGMVTSTPIPLQTRIMVEVSQPGLPMQRHASAVVACREVSGSKFRLGVKFVTFRGVMGTIRRFLLGQ